jgi:inner membrane protein
MDSLSQIVLGAAVGEIAWGRKMGSRAQLLGAIGGTLPDLDILLNFIWTDPIDQLRIHRGYSHSIIVHLVAAIPPAWLTWKWMKNRITLRESWLVWYLFFFTHALLDCCTTYGTQLFQPFTDYLVGFNNISVVDPLWTLPFMLALLVALFIRRDRPVRRKWAMAGIAYATAYMVLTFANKWRAHQHFLSELARQHVTYTHFSTSPSIFNNVLWSCIAASEDSIHVGEYSLLQSTDEVKWISYPIGRDHLRGLENTREVSTLHWFSQGYWFAETDGNHIDYYLVKWGRTDIDEDGSERAFVFHWELYPETDRLVARQVRPEWGERDFRRALSRLWRRIFEA